MPVPSISGCSFSNKPNSLSDMPLVDAHAVIADEQQSFAIFKCHAYFNLRLLLIAHELDGIVDKVLKQLHQPGPVAAQQQGLLRDLNLHAPLGNPACHKRQGLPARYPAAALRLPGS